MNSIKLPLDYSLHWGVEGRLQKNAIDCKKTAIAEEFNKMPAKLELVLFTSNCIPNKW